MLENRNNGEHRRPMKANRFPFTVVAVDDGANITMDCGHGVFRSRTVPNSFLRTLVDACRETESLIETLRRDKSEAVASLPAFPNCRPIGDADLGPCSLRITASRGYPDAEFQAAFYDKDDVEAPALLLIDEQIGQFIREATRVLDERAVSPDSPAEATDVPQRTQA